VSEQFSYSTGMNLHHGVRDIAENNLLAWKQSGVVKTLKFYSADDGETCGLCEDHHGTVVAVEYGVLGLNLPPLDGCTSARCRCYFRPWDVLVE
jgi:hypothetical protein